MEIDETIKCYETMAECEEEIAFTEQANDHRQLAKRLKELKAYRQAYEDIRNLTISWEEGMGIEKCISIIEKYIRNI